MFSETITWNETADGPPDSDTTVLVCNPAWDNPVQSGFYNGENWQPDDSSQIARGAILDPPPIRWADLPTGEFIVAE
jgi:hypothetical protein